MMKISRNAVLQFRKFCINESETQTFEVIYKINRAIALGKIITFTDEESFIVGFGMLRVLCEKGVVKSVWKDFTKSYKSNTYRKYIYDYTHKGEKYANEKYSSNYQSN